MKRYIRSSISLDRKELGEEQQQDHQVTDMYPCMMLMEGNSHGANNFLEWCLKDALRIGDKAYVVEVEHSDGYDYCCVMRGI